MCSATACQPCMACRPRTSQHLGWLSNKLTAIRHSAVIPDMIAPRAARHAVARTSQRLRWLCKKRLPTQPKFMPHKTSQCITLPAYLPASPLAPCCCSVG